MSAQLTVSLMFSQTGFPSPPEGLVIELVTPLTASGELDDEGLTRLVGRAAPRADALLVGGPEVGEALVLAPEVRRRLLSGALAALEGRLPLLVGITGQTSEETREWALAVRGEVDRQQYRGQVFLVDLPLWHHSNRNLPRFYRRLLREAALPLILVNLPQVVGRRAVLFKHRNLRTQVVKKLAALPAVTGLIYRGDIRRFLNYHLATVARPDFAMYEADEHRFLTSPGAWGVVSPGALLHPEAWQRLTRACLHPEEVADDLQARRSLWQESSRLVHLVGLYRQSPAPLIKAALAAQGVLASDAIAPGTPPVSSPKKQRFFAFPQAAS